MSDTSENYEGVIDRPVNFRFCLWGRQYDLTIDPFAIRHNPMGDEQWAQVFMDDPEGNVCFEAKGYCDSSGAPVAKGLRVYAYADASFVEPSFILESDNYRLS